MAPAAGGASEEANESGDAVPAPPGGNNVPEAGSTKAVAKPPTPPSTIPIPDLTRLPKTTVPKRYELKLDVEPEKRIFSGKVNIRYEQKARNFAKDI